MGGEEVVQERVDAPGHHTPLQVLQVAQAGGEAAGDLRLPSSALVLGGESAGELAHQGVEAQALPLIEDIDQGGRLQIIQRRGQLFVRGIGILAPESRRQRRPVPGHHFVLAELRQHSQQPAPVTVLVQVVHAVPEHQSHAYLVQGLEAPVAQGPAVRHRDPFSLEGVSVLAQGDVLPPLQVGSHLPHRQREVAEHLADLPGRLPLGLVLLRCVLALAQEQRQARLSRQHLQPLAGEARFVEGLVARGEHRAAGERREHQVPEQRLGDAPGLRDVVEDQQAARALLEPAVEPLRSLPAHVEVGEVRTFFTDACELRALRHPRHQTGRRIHPVDPSGVLA